MEMEYKTEIKKMKLGNKMTVVLFLSKEDYNRIEPWFDEQGRPNDNRAQRISDGTYSWDVHLNKKYTRHDRHTMWGICGDSTCGDAPMYFNGRYFGNIRRGRVMFETFLKRMIDENFYEVTTISTNGTVVTNIMTVDNNIELLELVNVLKKNKNIRDVKYKQAKYVRNSERVF